MDIIERKLESITLLETKESILNGNQNVLLENIFLKLVKYFQDLAKLEKVMKDSSEAKTKEKIKKYFSK